MNEKPLCYKGYNKKTTWLGKWVRVHQECDIWNKNDGWIGGNMSKWKGWQEQRSNDSGNGRKPSAAKREEETE